MPEPAPSSYENDIKGVRPGLVGVVGYLASGPNRAFLGELVNRFDVAVVNGNQQFTITYQNDNSQVLTRVVTVPMVGAGQQVDARSARYVYLYKYAAALPNVSELAGAVWGTGAWTTRPAGWVALPSDAARGAGEALYEALTLATPDGSGGYALDTWTIRSKDGFDVRWSDSLAGTNPYSTFSNSAKAWDQRDPITGAWRDEWIPLGGSDGWQNLFDVDLSALTQTAYQSITLATTGLRAYQVNEFLASVQLNDNHGAAQFIQQAVFRPQVAGVAQVDMTTPGAAPTSGSNGLIVYADNDEMRFHPGVAALPAVSSGAIDRFGMKFGLVRPAHGHYDQINGVTAHFAATGQNGRARLYWR